MLVGLLLLPVVFAANMSMAPSLFQRNYYSDEVKIVNPCLPTHMAKFGEPGGNMPDGGWWQVLEKCENQSKLETQYGAVIMDGVQLYSYDGMFDGADNGRINAIYGRKVGGKVILPVKTAGYSLSDATNYAYNMVAEITTAMNGQVFLKQKGNCISLLATQLAGPTSNAIMAAHYAYPYVHVVNGTDGWCFNQP